MSELNAFRIIQGDTGGYGTPSYKCDTDGNRIEEWSDACEVYDKYEVDAAFAEIKAENRRLKRALWLARALRARDIQRWWIAVTCAKITERACSAWNNVERKCRAKAEIFKEAK